MDKLSELLKEAKPLYKKRKRNRTIAKIILSLSLPVFCLTGLYELSVIGDNIYLSMSNENYQQELIDDDFGIFITK